MNVPNIRLKVIIGIYLLIMLAVIFPTPLHNWLADISVLGVPLDLAVVAFVILFTPVTILASIMRKFDVDFVDEGKELESHSDGGTHMMTHA